ncbi:hypothetical protein SAMD00023353_6300460 [Rosellinia necatrix]|uniref:Uncharacterized protein n=1 Tax=Rosellinia necatrix TaxID=77044 RepID=A0A1W2TSA8_ROSNE|nr:hypothetical protein SAMD00023353_6300460 [Rosellinia necatrix]
MSFFQKFNGQRRAHESGAATLKGDESRWAPDTATLPDCHDIYQDFDGTPKYEAWEAIYVQSTMERASTKRVFGVTIATTNNTCKDGYTGVRAIPSFTQHELGETYATEKNAWTANWLQPMSIFRRESYDQNLERRIFDLPASLPSKIGALLDCRFTATNNNPCVRREWKAVALKRIHDVITDEGGAPQDKPIQKWLVVIRGQSTRVSKKAFPTFSTMSNPWLDIDEAAKNKQQNSSTEKVEKQ